MTTDAKQTTATMISAMTYRDPDQAIAFLTRAFGFEPHAVHRGQDGKVVHAELKFGNGMIMIGPEQKGEFSKLFLAMPKDTNNRCTQTVYCIVADADAHHAMAAAAGAEIVMPLKSEDYGGRGYAARDLDGHVWSFGTYDPWSVRTS
jgi:uncharacterized glyoxalase superfamily protein PhnB